MSSYDMSILDRCSHLVERTMIYTTARFSIRSASLQPMVLWAWLAPKDRMM